MSNPPDNDNVVSLRPEGDTSDIDRAILRNLEACVLGCFIDLPSHVFAMTGMEMSPEYVQELSKEVAQNILDDYIASEDEDE